MAETPSHPVERVLLWIGAALVLLVVGFVSLTVLRPQLTLGDGSGSWGIVPASHQVISRVSIQAGWASWGGFEVAAVEDVPGATVAGAWILRSADADSIAADSLAEQVPDLDLIGSVLPQRLGHEERADLIVLWDITDCEALVEGRQPEVVLHNLVGYPLRRRLQQDISAPSFDLASLVDAGICPPR